MLGIELSGSDCHWAIQENGKWFNVVLPEHVSEMIKNLLGAPYGKRWNQYFAIVSYGMFDQTFELGDGFTEWPVIAISVRGLHENDIGVVHQERIAQDRLIPGAKISGENHISAAPALIDYH